jgi:hypothetical protein
LETFCGWSQRPFDPSPTLSAPTTRFPSINTCWTTNTQSLKLKKFFTRITGGKFFCTLEFHKAYLHLPANADSTFMHTISKHKGPYKVNRLMFGSKTAPNVYQSFMDKTLKGFNPTTNLSTYDSRKKFTSQQRQMPIFQNICSLSGTRN